MQLLLVLFVRQILLEAFETRFHLSAHLLREFHDESPKFYKHILSIFKVFCEKGVLRNFTKFTGKHPCQSLFFNKFLLKKRLWHRCFPVNFVKFLGTPFLLNTSGRLLLNEQMKILKDGHSSDISAHSAQNKTYDKIREHFYWPNRSNDIREWMSFIG